MHRNWCGTYNVRNPDDIELFVRNMQHVSRAYVYQMEVGDEFQPHLQIVCQFDRTQRLAYLKTNIDPTAHWEPMRGTVQEAVAYCTKDDTRVEEPVYYGDMDITQGKRTDLETAITVMKEDGWDEFVNRFPDIYVKYHRGMLSLLVETIQMRSGTPQAKSEVWFLHGPTGTGKTRLAFSAGTGSSVYLKDPTHRWWDGFTGQNVVIVDDFTAENRTGVTLEYLLRLLDIYPISVEVKGSMVKFNPEKIFITSNFSLEELFPGHRQIDALKRRIDHIVEMK